MLKLKPERFEYSEELKTFGHIKRRGANSRKRVNVAIRIFLTRLNSTQERYYDVETYRPSKDRVRYTSQIVNVENALYIIYPDLSLNFKNFRVFNACYPH